MATKLAENTVTEIVAPTGTVSLLADNVSSGIEPVYAFTFQRTMLMPDGSSRSLAVSDYAYRLYREMFGEQAALPPAFRYLMKCCKNRKAVSPVLIGKFC